MFGKVRKWFDETGYWFQENCCDTGSGLKYTDKNQCKQELA